MEGGSPAETRRPPRPPKQHGQTSALPEHPEAACSPHAILESKVKALKEKRGAGRPGTPVATPERPSPKKTRPRRGKPGTDVAALEPRAQLRTYLTDGLLDGGEPVADSPPVPRASTPGLWRVPAPRGDVPGGTELPQDEGSGSQGSASPHETPPLEEEARTPLWDREGPSVSPAMAEGWERLSLAERVERNRRLLQEVLGLAAPGAYFGQATAVLVEPGGAGREKVWGEARGSSVPSSIPPGCGCSSVLIRTPGPPRVSRVLLPLHRQQEEVSTNKMGCFFTGVLRVLPEPSGLLMRNFPAKSKRKNPHFLGHPRSAGIVFPSPAATRNGN